MMKRPTGDKSPGTTEVWRRKGDAAAEEDAQQAKRVNQTVSPVVDWTLVDLLTFWELIWLIETACGSR